MKRLGAALILLFVIITGTACTKRDTFNDKMPRDKQNMRQEFTATPDRLLARNIMTIERLKDTKDPLTKEQIEKLKPTLKEIAAKETMDKTFADDQIKKINDILTAEQKEAFNMQRGNRQGNGENVRPQRDNQPQGENPQVDKNQDNQQAPRRNRQDGENANRQGLNIKDVCDRVLKSLE